MIEKLNLHYSFTNPASIHDEEALTALELAGRQGAKINEVIEAQNALKVATENHLSEQDDFIDNMNKVTMPEKVNNEIDRAIESGEFDQKINAYMGNLNERVNNLIENTPENGTTMDAEIVDGRIGYDDLTYSSMGNAIRGQMHDVGETLNNNKRPNLLDPVGVVSGAYLNWDLGHVEPNDSYWTTALIPVKPGKMYHALNNMLIPQNIHIVGFYDHNKVFISGQQYNQQGITVPGNAKYMRFSININVSYNDAPEKLMFVEYPYPYDRFMAYGEFEIVNETTPQELIEFPEKTHYTNRLNPARLTASAYPSMLHSFNDPGSPYYSSNFIRIHPGEKLALFDDNMNPVQIRMWAGYTAEGVLVRGGEFVDTIMGATDFSLVRLAIPVNSDGTAPLHTMVAEIGTPQHLAYGEYLLKADKYVEGSAQVVSMLGGNTSRLTADNLPANETLAHTKFPSFLMKSVCVAHKHEFDSFNVLDVGMGQETYKSYWFNITPTHVSMKCFYTSTELVWTVPHGLAISGWLFVSVNVDTSGKGLLTLTTKTGVFTREFESGFATGEVFAIASHDSRNVVFTAACNDFAKPLWIIGDSFMGATPNRIYGQLTNYGYNNFMLLAMPGLNSVKAFEDVNKALAYGTPKTIVWAMGMNDGTDTEPYASTLAQLKGVCAEKQIELVITKVPSTPDLNKAAIHSVVVNSGHRYIDLDGAVRADDNGNWNAGLLSADSLHPTEQGARVLAAQMLLDCPEIISYGRE